MTQRQQGNVQTSFVMSSTMSLSCSTHCLISWSYLSRVYSLFASLAFFSRSSRAVLKALSLSAAAKTFALSVIIVSRQLGSDPGPPGGQPQSGSVEHGVGSSHLGGQVAG